MMTYFFEVLPLHPQPEYLESLTSYLMRLAELNGISSIDGLSALSFPYQDRGITRGIADYPPVSMGSLMILGACSEAVLRPTTFFHLTTKFGRSTLPQPTSRFLSGCISQNLRYCPLCINSQQVKYYLLHWRFCVVTCCYKHKCRLLETCGHCGESIPLFVSPFKLGNCPKCQHNLAQCATALVSDEAELESARHLLDDIIFLLTPQQWEGNSNSIIRRVGRKLAHMRQMKQLTAVELADQIEVTLTGIEGIERGDPQRKGATLQSYIKYARLLRLGLKEVFSAVIDAPDYVSATSLPSCPVCQQSSFVTRSGYNRSGSQRYQCQHCHRGFTAVPKVRSVKKFSSSRERG